MKGDSLKELRDAVRTALEAKGKSQRAFADENLLDYDDFRMQLVRNAFSKPALKVIARLLKVEDADALQRRFEFNVLRKGKDETLSPVQVVEERVRRSLKGQEKGDLVLNLRTLYAWLKEGDLVVICTLNESPLECSYAGWNRLGKDYVKAIASGATFLYIRPRDAVLEKFPKDFVDQFFGRISPDEEVQKLRSNVVKSGVDQDTATKGIRLLKTDFCPFWVIGLRFGFYSVLTSSQSRDMALFARFPFGGTLDGDAVEKELILLANPQMREAFQSYLSHCFSRKENKLSDLSYALSDIVE